VESQAKITNVRAGRRRRHGGGKEAFTVQEFGDALGVSKFTVARKIKSQEVRAILFGRRILIPHEELDRILGRV
jgi:excisionase family DNA binding protein